MARQAHVLIGTQMIAKGLDLPLVTLVGVVSADVGLNMPDFRAGERTFQLLTQVAGRAGRGLLGGRVIVQTYQPDNYAVVAASTHDYNGFYEREIEKRREIGYPPFRRMARILFTDRVEQKARVAAERAAESLNRRIETHQHTGTHLIGPAPCFFGRINRVYRWQILLRGPDPSRVLEGMDFGPYAYVDVDPVDIL
jgi:primosomal protein N' (replication factor Y)